MKKWLLGVFLLILGSASGYFFYPSNKPYLLNYNHIALNVLIEYTKDLANPLYPNGEKYLAEDMMAELNKLGIESRVYSLEETYSNRGFNEGIELYLRPWPELRFSHYHDYFDKDRVSVLFETFPYNLREVENADIVFTGSLKQLRQYQAQGIEAYFLPQFTRFDKFYPAYNEAYKTKLLFIGNQWDDKPVRKTVQYAKDLNLEIDVIGNNWDDVLNGPYAFLWKKKQAAGDELKYYYSSADIVLNDTREDMIEAGFISNRIFDVTACKGFIISDYIPEIAEIYGDAIPMYKTRQEFKVLIEYYLAHPDERQKKAEQAHQITLKRFGAQSILQELIEKLKIYQQKRHLKGVKNGEF